MKRWYGKLLGFIAGWLLLRHPFGGLIGLLIGHAFDADFLRATFLAYMEHSGRHIDVFEKYVDAFWTGRLTEAEQALFQQACTDQSAADAYVAGFADPEQLVRLLQNPRT